MSTTVEFGNDSNPDNDQPWRGIDSVTVKYEEVTQKPNVKSTKVITIRTDDGTEISGTYEDMRRLAMVLIGMTDGRLNKPKS